MKALLLLITIIAITPSLLAKPPTTSTNYVSEIISYSGIDTNPIPANLDEILQEHKNKGFYFVKIEPHEKNLQGIPISFKITYKKLDEKQ